MKQNPHGFSTLQSRIWVPEQCLTRNRARLTLDLPFAFMVFLDGWTPGRIRHSVWGWGEDILFQRWREGVLVCPQGSAPALCSHFVTQPLTSRQGALYLSALPPSPELQGLLALVPNFLFSLLSKLLPGILTFPRPTGEAPPCLI